MYLGTIVSEDATTTMIMFTILDDADNQEVARRIKEKLTNLDLPVKLYFGGMPFMMNDVENYLLTFSLNQFTLC